MQIIITQYSFNSSTLSFTYIWIAFGLLLNWILFYYHHSDKYGIKVCKNLSNHNQTELKCRYSRIINIFPHMHFLYD